MPLHQQVTTCLKSGNPVSKSCSCVHCTLPVCAVCGSSARGLTTACPGEKVTFTRQQEIYETSLDYTDERGWHLGESTEPRSPRFTSPVPKLEPAQADPRAVVVPSINWASVDQTTTLQHDLSLKAIAWALADRACDDVAARELQVREKLDLLYKGQSLDDHTRELIEAHGREKANFQKACRRVERCDEELHQAARRLVALLEQQMPGDAPKTEGDHAS